MGSPLLETEFTVADEMRVYRKWLADHPGLKNFRDGKLLILSPSCPGQPDLKNLTASAITPSGKEVPLPFDKAIINQTGGISLFIEGILTRTVPKGSRVRFQRNPGETANINPDYLFQAALETWEAEKILPRLEEENIRFQIDTKATAQDAGKGVRLRQWRIDLFIHNDDLPAWEKFRAQHSV